MDPNPVYEAMMRDAQGSSHGGDSVCEGACALLLDLDRHIRTGGALPVAWAIPRLAQRAALGDPTAGAEIPQQAIAALVNLFAERLENGVFSSIRERSSRIAAARALAGQLVIDLEREIGAEQARWRAAAEAATMDSLARMASGLVQTAQRRGTP